MKLSSLSFAVLLGAALLVAGIHEVTASNHAEGRKRGARGGALLGLTMGAVAGDARWAAAGAVVGGVAGGVAGDWADYQDDREDYRTETLAGAIASKSDGGEGQAPAGWNEIDAFVGDWQVTMWSLDAEGERYDATAKAVSRLDTTSSITFTYSDFVADELDLEVTGTTSLSFSPDRGFEMINHFSSSDEGNRFVGNFNNGDNKYVFFFAGSDQETFTGIQRTDYRLEMQMVGGDVIVLETWAAVGSEEKRVQSYRLTRLN